MVWIDPGGGFEQLGLQSFNGGNQSFAGGFVKSSSSGGAVGAGVGARFLFVTLVLRARIGVFDSGQLYRFGPEIGFHVPLGRIEPHAELGLGYASMGGLQDTVGGGAAGDIALRGFYTRVSAGLDYYPTPIFSLGAAASPADLLVLSPARRSSSRTEAKGIQNAPQPSTRQPEGVRLAPHLDEHRRRRHALAVSSAVAGLPLLIASAAVLLALPRSSHTLPPRRDLRARGACAARARRRARGPRRSRRLLLVASVALGALAFVPAWLLEGWVENWAGLDEHARQSDVAGLVYAFFVVAPLEAGAEAPGAGPGLAVPALHLRRATAVKRLRRRRWGSASSPCTTPSISPPAASRRSMSSAPSWPRPRTSSSPPPGASSSARGVAQGGARRVGGRTTSTPPGSLAMLFNGIYDHIAFGRGRTALFLTAPLLLGMAVVAAVALRSLRAPGTPDRVSRFSIAPPSIAAVRAALWRTEQPVMIHWIGAGALVTVGVLVTAIAAAVLVGRRIGVDFAAVDRADGSAGLAPLVLLGGAVLLAFPFAGYLISRASASSGVLEAAIASPPSPSPAASSSWAWLPRWRWCSRLRSPRSPWGWRARGRGWGLRAERDFAPSGTRLWNPRRPGDPRPPDRRGDCVRRANPRSAREATR